MKTKNIIIAIVACCLLAIIASQIASSHPDGLEWVAEKIGFLDASEGKETIESPMPDYEIPAVKNSYVSTILAGTIGTLILFAILYIFGKLVTKKRNMNN